MTETVTINSSFIENVLVGIAALASLSLFLVFPSPYTPTLVFVLLLLVWTAHYTFESRESMSEMCCMMGGMFFGMVAGFFVGTLVGLATADFLTGMIAGTVAGFIFGVPIGRFGGHLGRMEGVMAAPMGGIMGGMTGVMIQYFNVALFMPFFTLVMLFSIWEMINLVKGSVGKIGMEFIIIGGLLSLIALGSTMIGDYSVVQQQQLVPQAPAGVAGEIQEVVMKINPLGYEPEYIEVKKGVPVRLTLNADTRAGCTRDFVLPEFKIRKLVPAGGSSVVEFTPTNAGTFGFSCSMNMARGTLVVK